MPSFQCKYLYLLIVHRLLGLPGNIKSALGLKLVTASSPRTCWVTVRRTSQTNPRSIHSRSSPAISPLFSTTSVPLKLYVLVNHSLTEIIEARTPAGPYRARLGFCRSRSIRFLVPPAIAWCRPVSVVSNRRPSDEHNLDSSLSVSFFPPNKEYVPLEELVKRIPAFAYQLYLADPATAKKIEDHVIAFSTSNLVWTKRFKKKDRNIL